MNGQITELIAKLTLEEKRGSALALLRFRARDLGASPEQVVEDLLARLDAPETG